MTKTALQSRRLSSWRVLAFVLILAAGEALEGPPQCDATSHGRGSGGAGLTEILVHRNHRLAHRIALGEGGSAAMLPRRAGHAPMTRVQAASILVVSDEMAVRDMLTKFLTGRGYRARGAKDAGEALSFAIERGPAMVVVDLSRSGEQGLDLARRLRAHGYSGAVVLLTSGSDEAWTREALALGSVEVVRKPVDLGRFAFTVEVGLAFAGPLLATE